LGFDDELTPDGYAWWYLDALSDDGAYGLTVIAFLGSAFSPYYAWARRRGAADPLNHCALNVALYARRAARWSMTERGTSQCHRSANELSIGPSSIQCRGSSLLIEIDERCAPLPRRLRGTVRLHPTVAPAHGFTLDVARKHSWMPIAPSARVEVDFSEPSLSWTGAGYLDSNRGTEPLERAFRNWTWSRLANSTDPIVLYEVNERSGSSNALALRFTSSGEARALRLPPPHKLPSTAWGVVRRTRADEGSRTRVIRTLEDAPFYSRTLLETRVTGIAGLAIHESLDLDRFRSLWVQCLLPFRMPRIVGRFALPRRAPAVHPQPEEFEDPPPGREQQHHPELDQSEPGTGHQD
jgi:carotenoid 1,2-hydratase